MGKACGWLLDCVVSIPLSQRIFLDSVQVVPKARRLSESTWHVFRQVIKLSAGTCIDPVPPMLTKWLWQSMLQGLNACQATRARSSEFEERCCFDCFVLSKTDRYSMQNSQRQSQESLAMLAGSKGSDLALVGFRGDARPAPPCKGFSL